ncbi:MAG: ABC transporter permease, partial [Comamonadaceae bacterium CG17_big_fil_post_rev_8_21_14_2_50_60_13]
FGAGNPSLYGIADYDAIISSVKADPELAPLLAVVTGKLQLGGVAGNFAAGVSRTVMGSGLVVQDQNQMRLWNDYNFPFMLAPLPLAGTSADSAVIGFGVARVLQLCGPLQVDNCPGGTVAPTAAGSSPAADIAAPDDIAALSAQEAQAPTAAAGATQIELLAATARGTPNVARLKVVKAEQQGAKELDDIFIALHLGQAQRL